MFFLTLTLKTCFICLQDVLRQWSGYGPVGGHWRVGGNSHRHVQRHLRQLRHKCRLYNVRQLSRRRTEESRVSNRQQKNGRLNVVRLFFSSCKEQKEIQFAFKKEKNMM